MSFLDETRKITFDAMRIECPDCRQRFDVTEEFLGKTVECGSCEAQFRVTDDVRVKEKSKFYPGEKREGPS